MLSQLACVCLSVPRSLLLDEEPVSSCEGGQYQTVCHPFGSSVRILKQMTSREVKMIENVRCDRCDLNRFVFVLFVFGVLTLEVLWLRTSAKRAWSLSSCGIAVSMDSNMMYVGVRPCPHQSPQIRSIYVACGEHDICTWPVGFLRWMRDFGWFWFVFKETGRQNWNQKEKLSSTNRTY